MHRLLALLLVVAVVSPAAPAPAAQERAWVRAASRNFVVYSDAGEARARAINERLESFRRLLAAVFPNGTAGEGEPLVVVAFADDAGMRPYKPLYDGRPSGKSGVFLSGNGRGLVLLDASAGGGDLRVVLHEYTHRALALREGPVPLWLNEGLADLFSTAAETPEGGEIGAPLMAHLDLLRGGPSMAFKDLIGITPEAPEYNELRLQGAFYANAWAAAHYLLLGRTPSGGLEAFLKRLGTGETQLEALTAVYGDPDALAQEIRSYALRPGLPRRHVTLPPAEANPVVVAPAPPGELEAYLGLALVLQKRNDEAAPHLERAKSLAPGSSLPYEALGLQALMADDLPRAQSMFGEALKRDSSSYRANYYFARVSLQLDEETAEPAVRQALARATSLNPAFPDPYALLSRLARRDGDFDAAIGWAERGIAAAPNDNEVRLALGYAQVAKRRYAEGEVNLRYVADNEENFALRNAAKLALRSLLRYVAAVKKADGAAGAPRVDMPLGVLEEIPEWLHLAPAGVRGRLESLECSGASMRALVRVGSRRLVYSTDDGPKVMILTLTHPGVELIDCGQRIDREAVVEFEPSPTDPSSGRLTAIIFLKPKPYTIVMKPLKK